MSHHSASEAVAVAAERRWAYIVIAIIVLLCFIAGYTVSTRVGNWAWGSVDSWLASRLPGYKALKELVAQVLGQGGGIVAGAQLHLLFHAVPAVAVVI